MKKALILVFATLFLSVTAGYAVSAEMAKEGAESGTVAYSCPVTVMMMGKDLQVTYDALGVFMTDLPDSPFNNASVRILGSGLLLKGAYTEVGSICFTLTNGHKVFSVYEAKGVGENRLKGKLTVTGGTGNFAGITGEGQFDRLNVAVPAMKGTAQGYTKSKFTWKVEKSD